MPSTRAQLTRDHLASHIREHVFGTGSSSVGDDLARRSVGIELEWLTSYRDHHQRLGLDQIAALFADLGPLPAGSRLTAEPGGQLELSSARFDSLDEALTGTATDLFVLDQACAARRIELIALGADPVRPPARVLDAPRYVAMQEFFDFEGSAGRTMMCNTASIQVNVGLGPAAGMAERWRLGHAICPTLIACFANSPFLSGGPSGWQSSRLHAWWTLDPSRAAPPCLDGCEVEHWLDYALDARVMLVRRDADTFVPLPRPFTFGQWLDTGHELGWPTLDDFLYHLTTLFPPIRPRGWFEIRVFDALPTPFWNVAAAVTHALLDPAAAPTVRAAVAGTEDLWIDAAQLGLGHPALERSAQLLFAIALDVLAHRGEDDGLTDVVADFRDRWVARGRTPADDRLDRWRRDGTLVPERESPVPYIRELVSEMDLR